MARRATLVLQLHCNALPGSYNWRCIEKYVDGVVLRKGGSAGKNVVTCHMCHHMHAARHCRAHRHDDGISADDAAAQRPSAASYCQYMTNHKRKHLFTHVFTEQRAQSSAQGSAPLPRIHALHVVLEQPLLECHQPAAAAAAGHHLCRQRSDGVRACAVALCRSLF